MQELSGTRGIERIDIQTSGPPSYEAIAQESCNELPPPSYTEAVALIRKTIGSSKNFSFYYNILLLIL